MAHRNNSVKARGNANLRPNRQHDAAAPSRPDTPAQVKSIASEMPDRREVVRQMAIDVLGLLEDTLSQIADIRRMIYSPAFRMAMEGAAAEGRESITDEDWPFGLASETPQ